MPPPERDAVLITGVYGTGKSSVAAETADLLERAGVRFAAIDLGWLAWEALTSATGSYADLAIANDRPIREVATEIVTWLGWA